jgi:hypothetical protein
VMARGFKLSFKIPTADEIATLRHIHRNRPPEHEASVRRATEGLSAFFEALERGEVDLADLPPDLRSRLGELQPERDSADS